MPSADLETGLRETLATFDPGVPRTTLEVASDLDLGRRSTYERLRRLADRDRLETKKVGANARVWWRKAPANASPATDADAAGDAGTSDGAGTTEDAEAAVEDAEAAVEEDLEVVLDRMSDGFYALDSDLRFTFVNDHAQRYLGVDETVVGEDVREALDLTEEFERVLVDAVEDQESTSFEDYYPPLDTWFENAIYPAESGVTVYFQYVSDRKARERELERYETIFETVSEGIYVVDDDGYFTHVNAAYEALTGYSRDDLVGSHVNSVAGDDVVEHAERIEAKLADCDPGDGDGVEDLVVESELERPNGETWVGESTFALVDVGDGYERIGAVRDVTERLERERELQVRVQQQSIVADLDERAIEDDSVDDLVAAATEVVAQTLGADYCEVLELDADADVLHLRDGVGWDDGVVGAASVPAVENRSQAAYTLATEEPVVVEDLATHPDIAGPELLTSHDVTSGISTVIGSYDDPWGILGVHDRDRREFAQHDVAFVQSAGNVLANAIDRAEREDDLRTRREELEALVTIHEVVGDVTGGVIEQSTRAEIEATVCEHLAATDSYAFAWFGDADSSKQTVNVRTQAGDSEYLDDVTISIEPDDPRSRGPTGRAFRTNAVQVSRDFQRDPRHDPWRDTIDECEYRSSAAIPIVHDDATYGVLNVYTERLQAFGEQERAVLARLGEIVGQAIAAAERKQALMSDELVELEFRVREFAADLDDELVDGTHITFDDVVPLGDDEFRQYGTCEERDRETLRALVRAVPHWEAVSFRETTSRDAFELSLAGPPVLSTVATVGGYVESAVLEEDAFRLTVHLAPSVDVRRVIDTVRETYPDADLLRRVQVTRTPADLPNARRRLADSLTDRQRQALEAAYHSGYFEWPRDANGESLAASLDVAPSTFHQHLRKAQQGVLDVIFDGADPIGGSTVNSTTDSTSD